MLDSQFNFYHTTLLLYENLFIFMTRKKRREDEQESRERVIAQALQSLFGQIIEIMSRFQKKLA